MCLSLAGMLRRTCAAGGLLNFLERVGQGCGEVLGVFPSPPVLDDSGQAIPPPVLRKQKQLKLVRWAIGLAVVGLVRYLVHLLELPADVLCVVSQGWGLARRFVFASPSAAAASLAVQRRSGQSPSRAVSGAAAAAGLGAGVAGGLAIARREPLPRGTNANLIETWREAGTGTASANAHDITATNTADAVPSGGGTATSSAEKPPQ